MGNIEMCNAAGDPSVNKSVVVIGNHRNSMTRALGCILNACEIEYEI